MSQIILWRGENERFQYKGITVFTYPFEEEFLNKASNYFWANKVGNNIWTIFDIDFYFTDAQKQLNDNNCFSGTKLCNLLNILIDSTDEIITWYSDYIDDLPIITERNEFLRIIEEGVKEPSCEAYAWYKK